MPVYKNFYLLEDGSYEPGRNSFTDKGRCERELAMIMEWPDRETVIGTNKHIARREIKTAVTEIDNDHAIRNSIDPEDMEIPW